MAAHNKLHLINDTTDHSPGTNGTLLGSETGALVEKAFGTAATANLIAQRDASGDLTVPSTPGGDTKATSKSYVDAQVAGARDVKDSVKAATDVALPAYTRTGSVLTATANGAFPTVDGVTISSDGTAGSNNGTEAGSNHILVKDGAAGADNGIYVLTDPGSAGFPWKLTRRTDADSSAEVTSGLYVWVDQGTTNGDKGFLLTTSDPITLNTTSLSFTRVSGLGQITAGSALTKTGDTLDVAVDGSTIEVSADALRVKDGGITLAKLADQKAKVALAGATPVASDFSSLSVEGQWAFAEGTGGRVWVAVAVDDGSLSKFAAELSKLA